MPTPRNHSPVEPVLLQGEFVNPTALTRVATYRSLTGKLRVAESLAPREVNLDLLEGGLDYNPNMPAQSM